MGFEDNIVIQTHRKSRYCRRCNAESRVYPKWKQLPYVNLEKGEIYQKLHITDNEAARTYICRQSVPSDELRELMTRAEITPGTSIPMMNAIERLWRATRPENINYRVETVEYVDRIKQIDELTPLCTPECDVLVLKRIIDPPVVETKTTSCCCSIS